MGAVLAASAIAIALVMTLAWVLSLVLDDVSIVDPVWPLGFIAVAVTGFLVGNTPFARGVLLLVLVGVWGVRLNVHLTARKLREPEEDRRYRAMRARQPNFRIRSLVTVFWLQGAIMWVVALPVMLAMGDDSTDRLLAVAIAGAALWLVGLFFETVGDAQLARFKANPANKGQVMDRGLWRYTRHPNYFGDACVWWGIFVATLEVPVAWIGIVGPILMTVLLMKVSGVTMTEATIAERRPAYRDYIRRTNAFFPGPPGD